MSKTQHSLIAVTMLVLCLGCRRSAPPAAEQPAKQRLTIKLSLILGDTSDWYRGAVKWKELVEARTDGRIRVKVFTNASLSNRSQQNELQMVQTGVLEASLESSILLSILDKRFSVFSMPWLFKDHDVANKVCDGPCGEKMLALLPENKLVGLAYGVNGFRQITNNQRPITGLADLENLKIRVPAIQMYIDIFRLFGADPSQMNFGELFTALKEGTMHAQENPLSVIWAAKLFEVQNHITCWKYSYDPIILCMNQKTWDGLSPEDQATLRSAAKEAMDYERQLVAQSDKTLLEELKSKGMQVTTLSPEALNEFREKAKAIYQQYRPTIGGELLDSFVAAARAAEG